MPFNSRKFKSTTLATKEAPCAAGRCTLKQKPRWRWYAPARRTRTLWTAEGRIATAMSPVPCARRATACRNRSGNPAFDRELLKVHAARHDQQRGGYPAACAVDRGGRPVCRHGHRHIDLGADHRHLLCRPRLRRAACRAHRRRRHRRCCHAAQLPARAFRQRAWLDLLRIAGLRALASSTSSPSSRRS